MKHSGQRPFGAEAAGPSSAEAEAEAAGSAAAEEEAKAAAAFDIANRGLRAPSSGLHGEGELELTWR